MNSGNIVHTCEAICPIMYLGTCVGFGRADIVVDNLVIELKVCFYEIIYVFATMLHFKKYTDYLLIRQI